MDDTACEQLVRARSIARRNNGWSGEGEGGGYGRLGWVTVEWR